MKRALTCMVATAALLGLSAPAEAAQVLLKDGRVVTGHLAVAGPGLAVTEADGKVESFPYSQIQAVSLDDQPIVAQPHDAGESKLFDNDVVVWTAVGANIALMVLAGIALYHATGH